MKKSMTAPITIAVPTPSTTIRQVVSPRGIEAWLVHDETVPLVAMRFAFMGGAAQDPAGRTGLAYFMSGLLDEGAGPYDSRAFHERLDDLAVEIGFEADRDGLGGSLRTLSRHRDEAFELVRLALNEPRFDADAIERVRGQIQSGLKRDSTEPNAIASRAFAARAFPGHPYGRPVQGEIDTIAAAGREDFVAQRARLMGRDKLKIAVVGAIDEAALGAVLDHVFGDLPEHAQTSPVENIVIQSTGTREIIDFDISQSIVRFGAEGLFRHDPDYIPAVVVNHILGGGVFQSRLFKEVREKRGLAYSVSSSLTSYDHAALIMGGTSTKNERVAESIAVIEEQIRSLIDEGPTELELDKAKKYLVGSYGLRFDSSSKIASQLLHIQLDGLGIDYMTRRNMLIDAVTLEDARRAAKRLLKDGKLAVTVVGKPEGL